MKLGRIRNLGLGNITNFSKTYKLIIGVGFLMAISTLIKILGLAEFSSDWFWFIAGLGLILEGTVLLSKQKKFDDKFQIVEKNKKNI
jgi:hypothetical protein